MFNKKYPLPFKVLDEYGKKYYNESANKHNIVRNFQPSALILVRSVALVKY